MLRGNFKQLCAANWLLGGTIFSILSSFWVFPSMHLSFYSVAYSLFVSACLGILEKTRFSHLSFIVSLYQTLPLSALFIIFLRLWVSVKVFLNIGDTLSPIGNVYRSHLSVRASAVMQHLRFKDFPFLPRVPA